MSFWQAKRKLGPSKGYSHYANIPDEQFTDAFHYTLFPNFAVSVWADGFISSERAHIGTTLSNASSTTGGTQPSLTE